jgi:tRNA pseudouridine55 synthase
VSEVWDGLLPVDKAAGPTSHDLVATVRASTGARRVGHTGTLDPSATGLLLLVLGRATRLARFVPDAPKTYTGTLALGLTTTTDDLAGDVVHRHEGPLPQNDAVLAAATAHLGRQWQVPPAFSARQVGGTRLYRLARRGIEVRPAATEVEVERLDLTPTDSPGIWEYAMVVSTGTYVRAIVRDLGAAVRSLRRTAIGPFDVLGAFPLPADRATLGASIRSRLIPIDSMPLDLPSIELSSPADVMRFAAGGVVTIARELGLEAPLAAVRDHGGRLVGVGESSQGNLLPRLVLSKT